MLTNNTIPNNETIKPINSFSLSMYLELSTRPGFVVQYNPVQSSWHSHLKSPFRLMHTPPFAQGLEFLHSSMSFVQKAPLYPRHLQIARSEPSSHLAPF